jgi:hypothetical protein
MRATRTVQIKAPWNGYDGDLSVLFGTTYTVVFWHDPTTKFASIDLSGIPSAYQARSDSNAFATVVTVPVEKAHTGVRLTISYDL